MNQLIPLLDHLAATPHPAGEWQGWRLTRIPGGANNLLFRATSAQADLAVKFTIRDERDRAGREFKALTALQQAGLDLAAQPVLLLRRRYPQPVVVQSWLAGETSTTLPQGDAEWTPLLEHYARLHRLTPGQVRVWLPPAVLNFRNAAAGVRTVQRHFYGLPESERTPEAQDLVQWVERARWPRWKELPLALCRDDANIANFIRRPQGWAAVDWEYSGWGDPAFELADLLTHPAFEGLSPERQEWLVHSYAALSGDPTAELRIRVYWALMQVWWVVRCLRYLYEVPAGKDARLATRPAGWADGIRAKYARYLAQAAAARQQWGPLP